MPLLGVWKTKKGEHVIRHESMISQLLGDISGGHGTPGQPGYRPPVARTATLEYLETEVKRKLGML